MGISAVVRGDRHKEEKTSRRCGKWRNIALADPQNLRLRVSEAVIFLTAELERRHKNLAKRARISFTDSPQRAKFKDHFSGEPR